MGRWRVSMSSAPTRCPEAASATAAWTAVVDLPVPPFSLAKMMKCGEATLGVPLDLAVRRPQGARPSSIGGSEAVQTVRDIDSLRQAIATLREGGGRIAFV